MNTKNGTGGIARNISATLQSLQTENEQLRAGYDAARQEIASLRAQPYDQQAMGLCHVCGWKGVIDYPDGPVCVACEHDKTLSPQPPAQAGEYPKLPEPAMFDAVDRQGNPVSHGYSASQVRAIIDADRAARGAAQAAPVDAESWLDLLAEARAALWQPANAALCERLDAFIDAARAAQKDTND